MFSNRLMVIALMITTGFSSMMAVTLDDVIAKNLEARGGVDKIKGITTSKTTGTMSAQFGEMAFVRSMKGNNMVRMDMTIQGMTMTQAYDGTVAWGTNPMGGNKPEKGNEEQTKAMAEQADFEGEFIDTDRKGYKLELIGPEDLEGSTAYKIKVTKKDGKLKFIFVDAATWLVVKENDMMDMGGQSMDVEIYYTNYQDIDGIQVPMQIDIKNEGQDIYSMTFTKIETKIDIPDSFFAFPG